MYSPLSVGNGEFAFTVDISGLQTFSREYEDKMPVATMSNWGWHTSPEPDGVDKRNIRPVLHDTFGRQVGYFSGSEGQKAVFDYIRENPHRFHLGNVGLGLILSSGEKAKLEDMKNIKQTLDLWRGIIKTRYEIDGTEVYVEVACHPDSDTIGVKIRSELIVMNRLFAELKFPYGAPCMCGADWDNDLRHNTSVKTKNSRYAELVRVMDNDWYYVTISSEYDMELINTDKHAFQIRSDEEHGELFFSVGFSKTMQRQWIPDACKVFRSSEDYWRDYWESGGVIDFSGSTDERAHRLEKRVILSQYLTAIQCSGSIPPQETGLTCNSWFGKAHLEMHWWHAAHFALWGHPELLENSLWWYRAVMPKAEQTAKRQGYKGVRWQKMVGPDGTDSPSTIATLLIWQQPHPIFYAELLYRVKKSTSVLEEYREIVFKTAEFMADFIHFTNGRYVLGPPLIPAQENHSCKDSLNPTYELEYWHWALSVAQLWKERLGEPRTELWDDILEHISPLPRKDGVYLAHEECPDTFTKFNIDHPSMLNAFGVLPGALTDKDIMRNTLNKVLESWTMELTWGWDYPVMAMCAARLGEPEKAIDCLFLDTPKNHYSKNGHNYQESFLPLYLPGNGGLLAAVAMMAAGWDNAEKETYAPGFPKNGKWNVRFEGIAKYI